MSESIDTILAEIRELTFTRRRRVFDRVQAIVSQGLAEGIVVQWPDVLLIANAGDFRQALNDVRLEDSRAAYAQHLKSPQITLRQTRSDTGDIKA